MSPPTFACRQQRVDLNLRAVEKIAKLRLPDDESTGIFYRKPVLKADDRLFAERRVCNLKLRALCRRNVVERRVDGGQIAVGVLSDEQRVSMRKSGATDVLAADAYAEALQQQRAERERLGRRPIDRVAALESFESRVDVRFANMRVNILNVGRSLVGARSCGDCQLTMLSGTRTDAAPTNLRRSISTPVFQIVTAVGACL